MAAATTSVETNNDTTTTSNDIISCWKLLDELRQSVQIIHDNSSSSTSSLLLLLLSPTTPATTTTTSSSTTATTTTTTTTSTNLDPASSPSSSSFSHQSSATTIYKSLTVIVSKAMFILRNLPDNDTSGLSKIISNIDLDSENITLNDCDLSSSSSADSNLGDLLMQIVSETFLVACEQSKYHSELKKQQQQQRKQPIDLPNNKKNDSDSTQLNVQKASTSSSSSTSSNSSTSSSGSSTSGSSKTGTLSEQQARGSSDANRSAKRLRIASKTHVVHALSTESIVNSLDDSSSQDEDSEPILGLLFKEQHDNNGEKRFDSSSGSTKSKKCQSTSLIDPAIDNSHKFLSLATNILDLINNCFATTDSPATTSTSTSTTTATTTTSSSPQSPPSSSTTVATTTSFLRSHMGKNLTEKQLRTIANIIKNLDENWSNTEYHNDFSRSLTSLSKILLSSMKSLIVEDDSLQASKFSGLVSVAETVLAITLNRTANEPCDTIKLNFVDFCTLLTSLANLDHCKNHIIFFPYAIKWVEMCRVYLHDNQVFAQQSIVDSWSSERVKMVLDATSCLLNYISNILDALKFISSISSNKNSDVEAQDYQGNIQTDWVDEGPCFNVGDDDDDESVDDSDDESLCNKLCTFTLTQKDFVNQHWYHCHTCNMIDKVGVCSVCAKVCHKDHDVSYSKFGAFFCDCAGRENSTCMALQKRTQTSTNEDFVPSGQSTRPENVAQDSKSDTNRLSVTASALDTREVSNGSKKVNSIQQQFAKQLEPYKTELLAILSMSNVSKSTLDLLTSLIPAYVRFAHNESHIGRCKRARAALDDLHTSKKSFYMTEALMLPTLGSQEGAFENVRVNYSGEHAILIKQLLSSNKLRRVAMTSLSSPLGKRQHLVVCHEKGKITLLQLNALLRQADSSKRKLTLTRLASAPIPFSVISIVANPFNDDILAVSGLKDCHILTFTYNGLVSSHIELHLDLSATEHIIKAIWIPGGQTEIAVLTSEVVKIYDLSENSLQPKNHLIIPFGQLKDATFVVPESKTGRYILIMDTNGRIFRQELESSTSNVHGLFYVTTQLCLDHPSIKEQDGKVNGGGVSLYYSHSFKMLFFSYSSGNFMASMPKPNEIKQVFPLEFEFSNSAFSSSSTQQVSDGSVSTSQEESACNDESSSGPKQTLKILSSHTDNLCQWSEVPGHVGVIMAVCQQSNNPVILMLRPDCVFAQEIRYLTIKSKITDATAIRHTTSSGEVRTTLILLCEDGSLRIYMASLELTDFWLKLSANPNNSFGVVPYSYLGKTSKRKKIVNKNMRKTNNVSSNPTFPVDFFENLTVMNEIEFGGPDILSVYCVQQAKMRLNTAGMYISCTKTSGFTIEVLNNDSNMVICGIRVQVGSQELSKSPNGIEIFGRNIPMSPQTARWYDIPLTREESLQAEKRLSITFEPSSDPNGITTIDSIKVYGKTKESFSWPEDGEEQANSNGVASDLLEAFLGQDSSSHYQKLLVYSMESLECCLNLNQCQNIDQSQQEELAKELSTSLLTVPYSPQGLRAIKSLLLTIYSSRQNYNLHRDSAALNFVMSNLSSFKQDHIDGELFSRLVFIMKSLCQSKLSNLTRLSECLSEILIERDPKLAKLLPTESTKIDLLIRHLHELFWHLYAQRPANISLASVASSGFINYEDTLQPLIELIYIATLHDFSVLSVGTDVIIGFLLSEDLNISLCARYTLIRLLRVRGIQNDMTSQNENPQNIELEPTSSQTISQIEKTPCPSSGRACLPNSEQRDAPITPDRFEPIPEQPPSLVGSQQSSIASQLRNVLRDVEGARHDNEDDIAIAIALSLQDDSQNNSVTDNAVTAAPTTSGRSELNFLSDRMPSAEELMSDTTASGVASDEEISASGPKSSSIHRNSRNQSLDCVQSTSTQEVDQANREKSSFNLINQGPTKQPNNDLKSGHFKQERLRQQHLMLLERLIEHLPDTRDAGGFRSISLLHVILVLTLDLDCDNEVDDAILKNLLHALRQELLWNTNQTDLLITRSPTNEVKLVIMRMFSILMSKVRTSSVASAVSSSTRAETHSCWSVFCSSITALSLIESNVLEFCYNVLKNLIPYWKTTAELDSSQLNSLMLALTNEPIVAINRNTLPKSTTNSQLPDLSPFFLRPHVKGHELDLFEDYPQLLTEIVLRIPYQIKKVSSSSSNNLKPVAFSNEWSTILCEYLMIPIPSYIKKHVRKLLTFICGSKEKYRQLRDFHFLESHMRSIKQTCCHDDGSQAATQEVNDDEIKTMALNYESMTSLVEHLKACIEIAQNRCINWQVYCLLKDQNLLSFLMRISLSFGDDVSPIVLELLQHALNSSKIAASEDMTSLLDSAPVISTAASEVITDQTLRDLTSESLNANLAQQLINSVTKDLLSRFIQTFLLETNLTSLRWQAHSLLYSLWSNFMPNQQLEMVWVLWSLWHNLPKYGRKATQFVDLVGFVTLKSPQCGAEYDKMFCQEALNVLRQQNELLINHPNAHIYSSIQGLVDLESYYLESEPCSVCNSPEVSYNNIKLSSIKVDSRFTTTTQIIKLVGSHTILKFSLRISDIKRSKMVKVISIYYNNRSVQSVVELKNKTGIWNLARKYSLSPNQTDVKIEFTLPIVACNLMIEFSEFYENFQASSETLQCPRCSTSVSANPGVCSNCGENVFQCHKCRSINYDEKDPFLCISCGFCKYARFDISLTAKPTCAVDPIENEEDRKKTVASISNLLEKADRVYKNLMQNKPTLELLLLRIHEQVMPDRQFDENILGADQSSLSLASGLSSSAQSNSLPAQSIVVGYAPTSVPPALTSSVNKAIQHLAQKYCVECKGLFEELSKVTHKVLASRRELVEYDNRQLRRCLNAGSSVLSSANRRKSRVYSSLSSGSGRCYGCATATVEHCITMLKALSTISKLRTQICESGVIKELVNFNLKNGSNSTGKEVRELLCSLTRDDFNSTTVLTDLLMEKIAAISKQDYQPYEISHIVRYEIALLSVTLESDDQCWELRLRCLIRIFAFAFELKNPTVMECLVIPCLKLLLYIMRPPSPITRRNKDKSLENIASVRSDKFRSRVQLLEWLYDSTIIFEEWRKRAARPATMAQSGKQIKPISSILRRSPKGQFKSNYLGEKYGNKWRLKCSKFNKECKPIASLPNDWLKRLLFNRASKTVRLMAKSLVEALFTVQSRRKEIIDLLTSYLGEIGPAGECAQEFYHLYKNIILSDHWRYYLALQGILLKIGELITTEIDSLQELEETTLNSSLSLGYSLKMLVELLTSFVTLPKIRSHYKSKLVGFVLKGYLSLRKLVVQRTKVIDETQEMLLELLEGMTTGSETETAAFINVCVEAIRNCHESDIRTPVFIFERLCSTIHPEENVHSEFFVSLEKDPQQEDYLQGRMLGNPYSSNETGIGPLMKDIKNKICQDCELLALLEDDSSMELLVSNKIISLDLPVRDVYKRIWCPENHESDAMRIVYRMRGLLGDATEEFIESFDSRSNEEVDEEQVYKMAGNMSTSGGLEIMLHRLKQIDDLSTPFKPLLDVILKLFSYCTKTKNNRLKLLSPELKTIEILLSTLKLALNEEDFIDLAGLPRGVLGLDPAQANTTNQKQLATSSPTSRTRVVDQILAIIETILREASKQPKALFQKFCSQTCGTIDDVKFLMNSAQALCHRLPHVSHKIIQVLPFLTLGDRDKMSALIDYFKPSINFERFDEEHSAFNDTTINLFCIMVDAIERNENGSQLKDFIVSERIVADSMKYLTTHAPPLKSSLLATSGEWKDFTSRPALKYVLRILGGLSQGHASTQVLISKDCIPVVHGLEQVSSDARVGTLAENLLEAIKQHPSVAEKIELVRKQTREEKKRLAMAVRERQLGALGMRANERGQVTAKSKLLEQCQDLAEDTGLICNICREGYKFQPTKVLGIYTFTKRCVLDEYEAKARKTYGYTTVTHFNTVHVECHMSAVRSARGRDEWDSAALQNANTRCNGLLPIWGPQVPESLYSSALARHNSYLLDSTGCRDIGYHSTIHDIRLQLLRFAQGQERSFSEDTGGGGPQSNLHLIPYMMQTALYVLNTTKGATREYKRTLNFLEMSSNEVLENCYDVDSPYYWITLAVLVLPPMWWKKKRLQFLQRLIICNHVRKVSIKPPAPMNDTRIRSFAYYKSALIFFAVIDSFYNIVFKDATIEDKWNQDWSATLAHYLKHNDQTVNDNIEVLLNLYQNSLLPCTSIERFFDIIRTEEIFQPNEFLANTLESV